MSMSDKPEDRIEDLEEELSEVEEELEETSEADKSEKTDERVYTKADIEKAAKRRQAALKKARELENELTQLKAQHETETERQVREASEEARKKAEEQYKPALVRKELYFQMATLGLKKDQIEDLVDLVKMGEIEIDEDFNVLGVEEEVDRIRTKFPKLFEVDKVEEDEKPAPRKRKVPKADASDRPAPDTKPKSSADKIRDRFLGKA